MKKLSMDVWAGLYFELFFGGGVITLRLVGMILDATMNKGELDDSKVKVTSPIRHRLLITLFTAIWLWVLYYSY